MFQKKFVRNVSYVPKEIFEKKVRVGERHVGTPKEKAWSAK
jgi:hypothetical protein